MKTQRKNFTILMLVLVLQAVGISHATSEEGLVAYYPFDGNANDESGRGNLGVVIDFDSLTGSGEILRSAPYIEDGFNLTTFWENSGILEGFDKFASVHSDSSFYAGSVSFITYYTDDFPILTRQGDGPFDLISIDLDSLYLGHANVEFTGVLEEGGTVVQSFVTDSTRNSMETFTFSGFNNLVSVSWDDLEFATLHHYDNIVVTEVPEPVTLMIDIKPQSCPNPFNVNSKGVLPVAILGSETVNLNDIDIDSIQLAGVSPLRYNFEDVATGLIDPDECECSTEGPDGYEDLTLKFDTQEIVDALGEVADGEEFILSLTGYLYDGTPIEGSDCILILKKGITNKPTGVRLPDLIISEFSITSYDDNSVWYSYTIKNIGKAPANLDGPTDASYDNVSIQAFRSADEVFNNAGDVAAGGSIIGQSPLGMLNPGETFTGHRPSSLKDSTTYPFLTVKIDWGGVVEESDETNNTTAIRVDLESDIQ